MRISSHATGIGCALLLSVGTTTVAMAAEGDNIEEVVVTGIRHGIEDAIEIKRDNGSIVEAISAEDIGKLPDTSIAESISRLPGLTSQRAEGRASAISLRGTDPGFTTALLNGREQVSTGDNRSIEFDQYPSELLSSVVVYKTPDAQLVGQGLAGTIDLRTTRPLDYGRRADGVQHARRSELARRPRRRRGREGLSRQLLLHRPVRRRHDRRHLRRRAPGLAARDAKALARTSRGTPTAIRAPVDAIRPASSIPASGRTKFITDGIKVRTDMGKNRRDGAMAALQWRPSDNVLERPRRLLHAAQAGRQRAQPRSEPRRLSGAVLRWHVPGAGTQFGYSNPDDPRTTPSSPPTLLQRVPLARNFLFKTQDRILALGWNNEWLAGDWTFRGDVSYSKAKRDEQQYETNAQIAPLTDAPPDAPRNVYDTGTFAISQRRHADGSLQPQLRRSGHGAGRPDDLRRGLQQDPARHGRAEIRAHRCRLSARIAAGCRTWCSASTTRTARRTSSSPKATCNTINGGYFQIAAEHLLVADQPDLRRRRRRARVGRAGGAGARTTSPSSTARRRRRASTTSSARTGTCTEKVATAFVTGSLDHELSSNVTLQRQRRRAVGAHGPELAGVLQGQRRNGVVVPFEDGKEYTDVLPPINLAFMLPDRPGGARRASRASWRAPAWISSRRRARSATTRRPVMPGGSGGNPHLDPWRANAFDLSYEKYFGSGCVSCRLAAFYKDLKTYIYNQTDRQPRLLRLPRDAAAGVLRAGRRAADHRQVHAAGERQGRQPEGHRARGVAAG